MGFKDVFQTRSEPLVHVKVLPTKVPSFRSLSDVHGRQEAMMDDPTLVCPLEWGLVDPSVSGAYDTQTGRPPLISPTLPLDLEVPFTTGEDIFPIPGGGGTTAQAAHSCSQNAISPIVGEPSRVLGMPVATSTSMPDMQF